MKHFDKHAILFTMFMNRWYFILYGIAISLIAILEPICLEMSEWDVCSSTTISIGTFLVPVFVWHATTVICRQMHHRNSADQFHGMPFRRSTICLTTPLTILVMGAVLLLVGIALNGLLVWILPLHVSSVGSILMNGVGVFAIAVLVLGATWVGNSITGSSWIGKAITAGILFIPRLALAAFSMVIRDLSFMYVSDADWTGNNLLFCFIFKSVTLSNILYTLILGIIYIILGSVLFCKRKSEIAGQTAPTPLLQHIFRICLGCILSGLITIFLYLWIDDGMNIFFFVLYVAVVFVYFLFELLCTKKPKKLLTAIPGLLLVAVFNFGVFGACGYAVRVAENDIPQTADINAVSFSMESDGYYDLEDYILRNMDSIEITDTDIIQMAQGKLEKLATLHQESTDAYYEYVYEDCIGDALYHVTFYTQHGEKKRNIYLNESEGTEIKTIVMEKISEQNKDTVTLPTNLTGYWEQEYLSYEQTQEVVQSYQEELQTMSIADILSKDWYSSLELVYHYDDGTILYLPIKADLIPQTTELYNSYIRQNNQK